MVLRAGDWFRQSGIQEASGGVARYYRTDLKRNHPLSTEITAYALSALLECTGQRVISSPQQHFATLGRACEDKLHGADVLLPSLGKELRKLLLACQHIRHRKIILAENPPNLPACKHVTWVVYGTQGFP